MKTAAVYTNEKQFFIHSYSKTKAGFLVASEPFIKLEYNVEPNQLVASIKQALENSKDNIPAPDFSQLNKLIASSFELKSSGVLDKPNIKYCSIKIDGNDILIITPSKHAVPPDKGHLYIPDEAVRINYHSEAEKVSGALALALGKCE